MLRRLSAREQDRYAHVPALDRARARILVVPAWLPGIDATTLGRLVVVKRGREEDRVLVAHELVHVRQWRELGVLGFLRAYLGEYVAGRRTGLGHRDAYARISFEREARALASEDTTG